MKQPHLQTQSFLRFLRAHRALLFTTAFQLFLSRRPTVGSLAPSVSSSIPPVAPTATATLSRQMGRGPASCGCWLSRHTRDQTARERAVGRLSDLVSPSSPNGRRLGLQLSLGSTAATGDLYESLSTWHAGGLTNRWSQPLAAVISTPDFMKQFLAFATLVPASGGSALSR
jgi:hypothetical protein